MARFRVNNLLEEVRNRLSGMPKTLDSIGDSMRGAMGGTDLARLSLSKPSMSNFRQNTNTIKKYGTTSFVQGNLPNTFQLGRGALQTGSLGLIDAPGYNPVTREQKLAKGIGNVTGFFGSPVARGLGTIGSAAIKNPVSRGIASRAAPYVTNNLARRVLPHVGAEMAESAAYLTGLSASRKAGLTNRPQDSFASDLAWGLGARGLLGGAGRIIKSMNPNIGNAARTKATYNPKNIDAEDMGLTDRLRDFWNSKNKDLEQVKTARDFTDKLASRYLDKKTIDNISQSTKNSQTYYKKLTDAIANKFRQSKADYGYADNLALGIKANESGVQASKVDPLIQEARKYKSAEEFVRKNTSKNYLERVVPEKSMGTKGSSLFTRASSARAKAREITDRLKDIAKRDQIIFDKNKNKTIEQLKTEIVNSKNFADENNTSYPRSIQVKEEIIRLKSQLTDIWNKAQQPTIKLKPSDRLPKDTPQARKDLADVMYETREQKLLKDKKNLQKKLDINIMEIQGIKEQVLSQLEPFNSKELKDLANIKRLANKKIGQEGDIESIRKQNPALVERVTNKIREVSDDYGSGNQMTDEEALNFALNLPIKADANLSRDPELVKQLGLVNEQIRQLQKNRIKIKNKQRAFNKQMNQGSRLLREQYDLKTPKQIFKTQISQNRLREQSNIRNLKQADSFFSKKLIDPSGGGRGRMGGISVPPEIFGNAKNWKDKGRFWLNTETPIRNFEDVAGSKNAKIVKNFLLDEVTNNERQAINWIEGNKKAIKSQVIDKLGIKPRSIEDKLTMLFGERKITIDELKKQTNNWESVIEANKFFRSFYDNALEQINKAITKYGYDPVPKRKDYYTHYQELGNVFANLGAILRSDELPRELAGLTADFKPGKKFFQFAQPRLGNTTEVSAIGAVETYLKPASKQIFHTDSIQKARALEKVLSDTLSKTKGVKPQFLSDFFGWYQDYVNTLSGKKSYMARGTEGLFGRKAFQVVKTVKSQTGANMVGGNIASALTNLIPTFTQVPATTNKKSFFRGMMRAMFQPLADDSDFLIDGVQSSYLRRNFESNKLSPTKWEKAGEVGNWLFRTIDKFAKTTGVTGKYLEGVEMGMSKEAAMKRADDYAARLYADRSYGQLPQIFQDQGLLSLATQFQTEVNNQISFIFKDIPRNSTSHKQLASRIGQIVLYSYLFNNVFEMVFGRRPAFDPIGVVEKAYEDFTNENVEKGEAIWRTIDNVADQLPFASTFTGGGRIPLSSTLPNVKDVLEGKSSVGKELSKPAYYLLPPTGGGQIRKTIEGINAYRQGGEFTPTGKLKFPIKQNFQNLVRTSIAGKYAVPEARDYFDNNRKSLGEKQTEEYKNQPKDRQQEYYDSVMYNRSLEKNEQPTNTIKLKSSFLDTIKETLGLKGDVQAQNIDAKNINLPQTTQQLSVLYDDAQSVIDSYEDKKTKILYSNDPKYDYQIQRDVELQELEQEYNLAKQMVDNIEKERPEQVFEIQIETYKSEGGQSVESRAKWVAELLSSETDEQKQQDLINKLWDEKVITKGSSGVAAKLYEMGINVWGYTETGSIGGKGKKLTKLTIPKVNSIRLTPIKLSFVKPKAFKKSKKKLTLSNKSRTMRIKV